MLRGDAQRAELAARVSEDRVILISNCDPVARLAGCLLRGLFKHIPELGIPRPLGAKNLAALFPDIAI